MPTMILHVDMDAFYASVEELDNPDLQGKCVIVGGPSNRGVVSAANYLARSCGVHSAMPVFQARQKCPEAVFLPPRIERYKTLSQQVMSVLAEFSPLVEQVSIDEAYMDISGCERLLGTPAELGLQLKEKIKHTVQLTCSVGIAPNKFLAKIASDMDKPDGLFIIMPEDAALFIAQLPVRKVPGVGKTALRKLDRLGIKSLGDVSKYPEKALLKAFGKFGRRLIALAGGIDKSRVSPHTLRKSVSRERTFSTDTADKDLLKKYLLAHSQYVARDLRRINATARTITLKIKGADFKQVTRRSTLKAPIVSSKTIYQSAVALLDAYHIRTKVRLIGLGASGLMYAPKPMQMDLFNQIQEKATGWEQVDRAVDAITQKFGKDAVRRATLTDK